MTPAHLATLRLLLGPLPAAVCARTCADLVALLGTVAGRQDPQGMFAGWLWVWTHQEGV